MHGLCQLAGAPYPTVSRWQAGSSDPTMRLFNEVMGKLDAALEVQERALLRHLLTLYPAGPDQLAAPDGNSSAPVGSAGASSSQMAEAAE